MPITYTPVPGTYDDFLFSFISETEAIEDSVYLDSEQIPTIGAGFNIKTAEVLNEVLEEFGFDTDDTSNSAVERALLTQIRGAISGFAVPAPGPGAPDPGPIALANLQNTLDGFMTQANADNVNFPNVNRDTFIFNPA